MNVITDKTKVYFALTRRQHVMVRVYNPDTRQPIVETDGNGNVKFQRGEKVYSRKKISFMSLKPRIVDGHPIKSCTYATSDEFEILELDECVKNPASGIIDEDQYNRTMNPLAYEKNKEIESLKSRVSSVEKEKKERDAMIDEMKKELERLRQRKG
jgi:predicted RNase H-like nuclease (RuvC/YqgF family)